MLQQLAVLANSILASRHAEIWNRRALADREGVKVGNEFSSVEALWSQFESVMAKDTDTDADKDGNQGRDDGDVQANDPQDDSEAKNMPEERETTVTTPEQGA